LDIGIDGIGVMDVDGVGAARGDLVQGFVAWMKRVANWVFGSIVLNGVRRRMKSKRRSFPGSIVLSPLVAVNRTMPGPPPRRDAAPPAVVPGERKVERLAQIKIGIQRTAVVLCPQADLHAGVDRAQPKRVLVLFLVQAQRNSDGRRPPFCPVPSCSGRNPRPGDFQADVLDATAAAAEIRI